MSIKTAVTYDTGKPQDVRELRKALKRSADRLAPSHITWIAARLKAGQRFMVTIPQSVDHDLKQRNRKAKRKTVKRSRRANRRKG